MALFLVEIDVDLPADLPSHELDALLEREGRRAVELRDAGLIRDMWRIPGRRANVGLWEGPSATSVHDAIASLPVWPWATVTVTALANHPMTKEPEPID